MPELRRDGPRSSRRGLHCVQTTSAGSCAIAPQFGQTVLPSPGRRYCCETVGDGMSSSAYGVCGRLAPHRKQIRSSGCTLTPQSGQVRIAISSLSSGKPMSATLPPERLLALGIPYSAGPAGRSPRPRPRQRRPCRARRFLDRGSKTAISATNDPRSRSLAGRLGRSWARRGGGPGSFAGCLGRRNVTTVKALIAGRGRDFRHSSQGLSIAREKRKFNNHYPNRMHSFAAVP